MADTEELIEEPEEEVALPPGTPISPEYLFRKIVPFSPWDEDHWKGMMKAALDEGTPFRVNYKSSQFYIELHAIESFFKPKLKRTKSPKPDNDFE